MVIKPVFSIKEIPIIITKTTPRGGNPINVSTNDDKVVANSFFDNRFTTSTIFVSSSAPSLAAEVYSTDTPILLSTKDSNNTKIHK